MVSDFSNSDAQRWSAVEIDVDPGAAEAAEHAFNSLESLGTEINHLGKKEGETVKVIGYFNEPPNDETLWDELHRALRIYRLSETTVKSVERREIENTDWLHEWKKHWKPTVIGRFVIAPPWEKIEETGKIVIRIEPNMAFGTGTHETTQLCLKSIEENYCPGDSFLDVGTGTGILAIAAAKLATERTEYTEKGPSTDTTSLVSGNSSAAPVARIAACDTDLNSINIARENAELNGVGGRIGFIDGPLPLEAPVFDFICANLTIDAILPILTLLLDKARKTLVLSGILADQEGMIRSALEGAEVNAFQIDYSGEWVSVTVSAENTKVGRRTGNF